ncbi:MAG TPA: helix-hairpin-helix domain-containing protein [Candidatus Binatia bacterium]|nr:helix-hairpin-helix domain-containing protein [Candidatus Binatia bacterium]
MRRQRASVLVGLLWCLALLSVVVIGVLHLARLDLMVVKNQGDAIQARYLALAGIEKAKALLYRDMTERKRNARNHSGELYNAPEQFRDVRLGRGEFSVFHQGTRDEGGRIVFGIIDEEARLNINKASSQELDRLYGMTPDIAAAIQDWRDGDNTARASGAEADYYASLKPPYLPRNGPFQTIRELLMVRGVTRDLLGGEDANLNGILDPEEDDGKDTLPIDDGDGVLDAGWSGLLTIDSAARNENASGQQRIDVQSADEKTLATLRGITPELAKSIVTYRGQNKFENIADLLEVSALAPPRPGGPTLPPQPPPGGAQGGPNQRGQQQQPIGPKLISEDMLLEMGDDITVGSDEQQAGAVNINTASLDVLYCLQGMTRELSRAIIAYRQSAGFFPNVAYLLKVDGMTRDIFKQISPKVCVRSETFRIMSEGSVPSSGTRRRVEMVVRLGSGRIDTLSYREDL